jgi:hypothetical protein
MRPKARFSRPPSAQLCDRDAQARGVFAGPDKAGPVVSHPGAFGGMVRLAVRFFPTRKTSLRADLPLAPYLGSLWGRPGLKVSTSTRRRRRICAAGTAARRAGTQGGLRTNDKRAYGHLNGPPARRESVTSDPWGDPGDTRDWLTTQPDKRRLNLCLNPAASRSHATLPRYLRRPRRSLCGFRGLYFEL